MTLYALIHASVLLISFALPLSLAVVNHTLRMLRFTSPSLCSLAPLCPDSFKSWIFRRQSYNLSAVLLLFRLLWVWHLNSPGMGLGKIRLHPHLKNFWQLTYQDKSRNYFTIWPNLLTNNVHEPSPLSQESSFLLKGSLVSTGTSRVTPLCPFWTRRSS